MQQSRSQIDLCEFVPRPSSRTIKNLEGPAWKRYAIAFTSVILASIVVWALRHLLPGAFFMVYLAAIAASTLFGGLGPGLLCVVLCCLKLCYVHFQPLGSFEVALPADRARLGIFVATSGLVVWLGAKLQRSYQDSEAHRREFRQFLDLLNHGIFWELHAETLRQTFISQGAERLLHYPLQEWLNEPGFLLEHTPLEDREKLAELFKQLRPSNNDLSCDHRLISADGVPIWFHTGVHLDCDGPEPRIRGFSVQVQAIKEVQEKLQKAVQEREDTLALISHDLRNPLGAILMNCSLLLNRIPEKPSENEANDQMAWVRRHTVQIERAAQRMNELIESLLSLAKIEAGHFSIQSASWPLSRLVRETVEILSASARERAIELKTILPAEELTLECDLSQLKRVLSNLVGNAIKFTPTEGQITVEVKREKEDLLFRVTDTGPGIAEHHLTHIFDRYWQASRSSHKGAGLGLSIAKGIVEAHGGKIWVESRFGYGCSFYFKIPREGAARHLLKSA